MTRKPLILSAGGATVVCVVDGNPTPNDKYAGAYVYPIKVNGQDMFLNASSAMHAKFVKMGAKFGSSFGIRQEVLPNGMKVNKIFDSTGNEIESEKKWSGNSNGGGQKKSYERSPEEKASIMAQWAVGKAVDALVLYKGEGNQLPDNTEVLIKKIATNFYRYKKEIQAEILQDLNNNRKEETNS